MVLFIGTCNHVSNLGPKVFDLMIEANELLLFEIHIHGLVDGVFGRAFFFVVQVLQHLSRGLAVLRKVKHLVQFPGVVFKRLVLLNHCYKSFSELGLHAGIFKVRRVEVLVLVPQLLVVVFEPLFEVIQFD